MVSKPVKSDADAVAVLVNLSAETASRVAAARSLAGDNGDSARNALLAIAQRDDTPPALAAAVGHGLGQICFRRSEELPDLTIAEMHTDAYIGYDEELARLLRSAPEVKMRRAS